MKNRKIFILILVTLIIAGCGKKYQDSAMEIQPVSIKVFNVPDGADLKVPPELGGYGFRGEGWETNINYNVIGDKNSFKGGSVVSSIDDFPLTLRHTGKDANTTFNVLVESLAYETLLGLDPVNYRYIPFLATHWQISEDGLTFRFRLNPSARFTDGSPVTTEDVIASYKLYTNPEILAPYVNILFNVFEIPVAESKYILSIKVKNKNWINFLYLTCAMRILPAHYIGNISGSEYLEKYKFDFIPGSGPYVILKEDINKENSIILRKSKDYWAENERFNQGKNNFYLIKFEVNRDQNLEIEKFKKGEIDILSVFRSSVWNEKLNVEQVSKGYIVKKKIFNSFSTGISGLVLNMRNEPFNDINVRKAFTFCYNREVFNEKLFANSYKMINSFFPGTEYENPGNQKIYFNLDSAKKYLNLAGWNEKNNEGFLIKDGKIFEIELPFTKGMERYFSIFKEDLRKLGINLILKEVDEGVREQLINERNFTIIPLTLSSTEFPNPDAFFLSSLADEKNTLNHFGIKEKRLDDLCNLYKITNDHQKRVKILREIDSVAYSNHPMIFGWHASYQRIAFWNKFGYPECGLPKNGTYYDFLTYWYFDPSKNEKLFNALKENKDLPIENTEIKFWGER